MWLDLAELIANPANIRRHDSLGDTDLDELTASVAASGVLVPLTVVSTEEGYLVVAGHRRAEAARRAGLALVACVDHPDMAGRQREQIVAMLVENTRRRDLTALEEARGYQQLALGGCRRRRSPRRPGPSRRWLVAA